MCLWIGKKKKPVTVRINRLPAMVDLSQQGSASSDVQQHQGTRPYYSQLSHQFVAHGNLWTLWHEYDSLLAGGGPGLSSAPCPAACSCRCTRRRFSAPLCPSRWWILDTRTSSPACAAQRMFLLLPGKRRNTHKKMNKIHFTLNGKIKYTSEA